MNTIEAHTCTHWQLLAHFDTPTWPGRHSNIITSYLRTHHCIYLSVGHQGWRRTLTASPRGSRSSTYASFWRVSCSALAMPLPPNSQRVLVVNRKGRKNKGNRKIIPACFHWNKPKTSFILIQPLETKDFSSPMKLWVNSLQRITMRWDYSERPLCRIVLGKSCWNYLHTTHHCWSRFSLCFSLSWKFIVYLISVDIRSVKGPLRDVVNRFH